MFCSFRVNPCLCAANSSLAFLYGVDKIIPIPGHRVVVNRQFVYCVCIFMPIFQVINIKIIEAVTCFTVAQRLSCILLAVSCKHNRDTWMLGSRRILPYLAACNGRLLLFNGVLYAIACNFRSVSVNLRLFDSIDVFVTIGQIIFFQVFETVICLAVIKRYFFTIYFIAISVKRNCYFRMLSTSRINPCLLSVYRNVFLINCVRNVNDTAVIFVNIV